MPKSTVTVEAEIEDVRLGVEAVKVNGRWSRLSRYFKGDSSQIVPGAHAVLVFTRLDNTDLSKSDGFLEAVYVRATTDAKEADDGE